MEVDIRMVKIKQKISRIFRSSNLSKTFTRIRGYISSIRKNTLDTFEAIQSLFSGTPINQALI